jgi:hypothetical protein
MNSSTVTHSFSYEEQASILFSAALLCIGSVFAFALGLLKVRNGQNACAFDCCIFTAFRLIYKKCCKCSRLNKELKKHLKDEDEDEQF